MVTFSVVTSARALSLFITTELHIYLCSAFAAFSCLLLCSFISGLVLVSLGVSFLVTFNFC